MGASDRHRKKKSDGSSAVDRITSGIRQGAVTAISLPFKKVIDKGRTVVQTVSGGVRKSAAPNESEAPRRTAEKERSYSPQAKKIIAYYSGESAPRGKKTNRLLDLQADKTIRLLYRQIVSYEGGRELLFAQEGLLRFLSEALDAADRGTAETWSAFLTYMEDNLRAYHAVREQKEIDLSSMDREKKEALLLNLHERNLSVCKQAEDFERLRGWAAFVCTDRSLRTTPDLPQWARQVRASFAGLYLRADLKQEILDAYPALQNGEE